MIYFLYFSLTDDEDDTDVDDTYNDDYSYTFEATETATSSHIPTVELEPVSIQKQLNIHLCSSYSRPSEKLSIGFLQTVIWISVPLDQLEHNLY